MTTNVYRALGATFGGYAPTAVRAKRTAPTPTPPKSAEPHRAYSVVLEQVERRIPRLLALLMSQPRDRPGRRRWREHRLETHGREAYQRELVQARQLRALCRRAITERWSRVPETAARALEAHDRANDNAARFAAMDQIKEALLRREKAPTNSVPRKACPPQGPRPRLQPRR